MTNPDGTPGMLKAKMPWLVVIAIVGIVYGVMTKNHYPDYKPRLLSDSYPTMVTAPIATFSYLDRTYTNHQDGTVDLIPWEAIILGSLKVALVAIIETQVSAIIAQRKYTQKHESTGQQPCQFLIRWEIFGMSCANLFSGLMGGTPCTGVLVRTAVNIDYGGESRASQLINSFYVLIITLTLMEVFVFLPNPVIASMLMVSCFNLGKSGYAELMKFKAAGAYFDIATFIGTCLLCVIFDGAVGLAVGLSVRVIIKCV